jgi:hypothetical protein
MPPPFAVAAIDRMGGMTCSLSNSNVTTTLP